MTQVPHRFQRDSQSQSDQDLTNSKCLGCGFHSPGCLLDQLIFIHARELTRDLCVDHLAHFNCLASVSADEQVFIYYSLSENFRLRTYRDAQGILKGELVSKSSL